MWVSWISAQWPSYFEGINEFSSFTYFMSNFVEIRCSNFSLNAIEQFRVSWASAQGKGVHEIRSVSSAIFIRCRKNRYTKCPRYLLINHKCLKLIQRCVHDAFEHLFLSRDKAQKNRSFLIGVHEITFTRLPQSHMTSAGKEGLRNRCVLRHRLHHLDSSYKLQTMLVSFTHAEGTTIRPTSCTESWGFLDAKVTRLSLFDPSGTRASVGCVH
jgi:hypothetical protein